MTCLERLEAYLRREHVPFEVHLHDAAFTAQSVAEHEHIPGQLMVKVVLAVADGELALLALPTSRRVDLARLSTLLDARELRLASESELSATFPDCEVGAMPPFGNLYDMRVYVDRTLEEDETIFFQAGNHTVAFSLAYADFKRRVAPTVVGLTSPLTRARPRGSDDVHETGGW